MNSIRIGLLRKWIVCLEDISKEFSSQNTSLNTAIKSFKSQLKELEKTK